MILASLPTEPQRLEAFQQYEVFYTTPKEQLNDLGLLTSFIWAAHFVSGHGGPALGMVENKNQFQDPLPDINSKRLK
jgi:hypothetical protein